MSVTIQPQNVGAIERAIKAQLEASKALRGRDATIERDGEPNSSESDTPWVGIYRMAVDYPTRTLGLGSGYRYQLCEFVIICQESDASSASACADSLEDLVADVVAALLSDPTLQGTVDVIDKFQISYPNYARNQDGSYFFQDAAIQFTARTTVTATTA